MTPKLTHIALHVEDLAACVDFYQRYCGLSVIHRREKRGHAVVWLSEAGREHELVLVILPGGPKQPALARDFSHIGFALNSKAEVDAVAALAEQDGTLIWPPVQEPYPVGYYCGVVDPNGSYVEFSYGQPLGPGSEDMSFDAAVER